MANFIYNGISFGYLKTHSVRQVAVYDESDTDLMYYKFTLSVESILIASTVPQLNGLSPTQQYTALYDLVMLPRKPLFYYPGGLGDSPLIQVPTGLDDSNGPKPRDSSIITPITVGSFLINYDIDIWLRYCPLAAATGTYLATNPDFASNRWSQSQDIDHKGCSTITTDGTLVMRSDSLGNGGPDALRGLITPPPRNGFFRESRYYLQKNGLEMRYTFVEKERYLMPPPGCVDASGTFTVSTIKGAKFFADVTLKLEGDRTLSKVSLMQMAIAICLNRLARANPAVVLNFFQFKQKVPFILEGSFRESMYDNIVELHLRALVNPPPMAKSATAALEKRVAWLKVALAAARFVSPVSAALLAQALATAEAALAAQKQNAAPVAVTFPSLFPINPTTGLLDNHEPMGSSVNVPAPLDNGLTGHLPNFSLVAAAFKDPCTYQYVSLGQQVTDAQTQTPVITGNQSYPPNTTPTPAPAPTAPAPPPTSAIQTNSVYAPWAVDGGNYSSQEQAVDSAATTSYDNAATLTEGPNAVLVNEYGTSQVSLVETFGTTSALDEQQNLYVQEADVGIWQHFYCDMTYLDMTGKIALPTCSSTGTVAFPQLHAEYMTLTVTWTASKIGSAPSVPPKESADPNLVFLYGTKVIPEVEPAADGISIIYSASGEYYYGVSDFDIIDEAYPIPPWLNIEQSALEDLNEDDSITSGTMEDPGQSQLVTPPVN